MAINCTINAQGCMVCPSIPPQPATPGQILTSPDNGWNAGANSIQALTGDVRVAFTVSQAAAMVVGLRRVEEGREGQTIPSRIRRGWRVRTAGNGYAVADVFEVGVSRSSSILLAPCDVLEIQRVGAVCDYLINGTLVHRTVESPMLAGWPRIDGPVFVTACLYASGDTVGACPVDA